LGRATNRTKSIWTEIWTSSLPNMKQEFYQWTITVGVDATTDTERTLQQTFYVQHGRCKQKVQFSKYT
jgi:hypothetical protein